MSRKRFSVEQIINHLREAEVLLAQGKTVGEICRRIGVSAPAPETIRNHRVDLAYAVEGLQPDRRFRQAPKSLN